MYNNKLYNRRKGPDALLKWTRLSGILSWFLVAVILFVTLAAKPGFVSYMDKSFHIKLESSWDTGLLQVAFGIMVFQFFFCAIFLLINMFRFRRKSDRFNPSLIINTAISLIGIILYIFIQGL